MQTIATLGKTPLAHLWPAGGLTNFTIDTPLNLVILGIVKLLAISFTVHGGFRGGYIFPAMAAGAAFGRAVSLLLPVPPAIAVLCTAAGVTVAITRTVFATTIILTALSGEVNAASPVLAASLGAAFATFYMPFIGSQRAREDRFDAQIHYRTFEVRGGGRVGGVGRLSAASPAAAVVFAGLVCWVPRAMHMSDPSSWSAALTAACACTSASSARVALLLFFFRFLLSPLPTCRAPGTIPCRRRWPRTGPPTVAPPRLATLKPGRRARAGRACATRRSRRT